jgi:CheY-like chemotaxis protein
LGLGLAISKALVDMHKGSLTAASEGKDRGAVFTLRLDTVPVPAAPELKPPARVEGTSPPSTGLRILLVEDHEDTLRVMARMLRKFGHNVKTAATVKSALDLSEGEQFDLLVSDIGLPDGSGLDIMRQLKAQKRLRGIALSGFGQDEDFRRSREAGFEQHLTKPVNFQQLQQVIQRVAC